MKKITILFIGLFISFHAFSQFNPYWSDAFQYTVSSGYSNEARKVAIDASGNVFVLSDITSDFDSINHPSSKQYYVVLRKYTPAGALMAQKIVNVKNMNVTGTYNYSSAFAIQIDGSNSVYIGYNKYNTLGANYDVGVIKYNNTLTSYWSYIYSTPANETGVDMVLRENSAVVLVKAVSGINTTYVVTRATPNVTTTTPLYSFDTNIDVVNSLTTAPTLNYFFTGYRLVGGTKVVMTASVSTGGVLKWKTLFNYNTVSGDDFGNKVLLGNDGFVYVAGTGYHTINNNNALCIRYNAANGTQNAHVVITQPTGTSNDAGITIANGPTGYIFMGATSGNIDVYLYKINTTHGLVVSASGLYKPTPTSSTGFTSLTVSDLKVAPSNNVYICGTITGTSAAGNFSASYLVQFGIVGGSLTAISNTSTDGSNTNCLSGIGIALDVTRNNITFVKNNWRTNFTHALEMVITTNYDMSGLRLVHENTSISTTSNEKLIYPNPAKSTINFKNNQFIEPVLVFDNLGKQVLVINKDNQSADVSELAPGIYFVRMINDSGLKIEKLIIE